jgi:hypothetical protein
LSFASATIVFGLSAIAFAISVDLIASAIYLMACTVISISVDLPVSADTCMLTALN